jgi:hypothetical protein
MDRRGFQHFPVRRKSENVGLQASNLVSPDKTAEEALRALKANGANEQALNLSRVDPGHNLRMVIGLSS